MEAPSAQQQHYTNGKQTPVHHCTISTATAPSRHQQYSNGGTAMPSRYQQYINAKTGTSISAAMTVYQGQIAPPTTEHQC